MDTGLPLRGPRHDDGGVDGTRYDGGDVDGMRHDDGGVAARGMTMGMLTVPGMTMMGLLTARGTLVGGIRVSSRYDEEAGTGWPPTRRWEERGMVRGSTAALVRRERHLRGALAY